MRSSEEVLKDIEDARQRLKSIDAELKELESQIELKKQERKKALDYSWHSGTSFSSLNRELAKSIQHEKDTRAASVVWSDGNKTDWIVEKVTKKLIFIRRKGSITCTQYRKDGSPVGSYSSGTIDVEKTLEAYNAVSN